jgi:hypothetical protein
MMKRISDFIRQWERRITRYQISPGTEKDKNSASELMIS